MRGEFCLVAPADWEVLSIEKVCKRVTSGGTPSRTRRDYYENGQWPWVKTQELKDTWIDDTDEHITAEAVSRSSAKVLPAGTVLMAMYGATVGQLGLVRRPMTCNQACCAMIVEENKADPRFLFYQLLAHRRQFRSLAVGAAQQNLSGQVIRLFELPFPNLRTQRAVGRFLGALDDRIALNRRMNATLEALGRAVFRSWFVDFDPVRAKADDRKPVGMDVNVAALFPSAMRDSPNGPLPYGWTWMELGSQLSVVEAGSRPKGGVSGILGGVPSIGAESIKGVGQFDFAKTKYVSREFFMAMGRGRVESWDVLLYKDGGRPGEFEPKVTLVGNGYPFSTMCINEHVYRLRAKETSWQSFLYFLLDSEPTREEMRRRGTGVAVPGLNSTALRTLPVIAPRRELVHAFARFATPLVEAILRNSSESRTLAELRDLLIPKLLSGELRVKDFEVTVAATG